MSFDDSTVESGPGFVGTKFCREWFGRILFFCLVWDYRVYLGLKVEKKIAKIHIFKLREAWVHFDLYYFWLYIHKNLYRVGFISNGIDGLVNQ